MVRIPPIIQVLSCHGPSKPQRVTSEPLLKDDQADYQPGLIVDGSLLMMATPSPVLMAQHSFLENNSLTSIDRSPTICQRDTKEESPYSCSVPAHSSDMLHRQPSWLNPQVRRATTSNLPAMSASAGWNFNPLQHYPVDDLLLEYSNQLVAPIATPETLSEESAGGSVSSLAKRAHKFLRGRAGSVTNRKKDSQQQLAIQHYSCSSSDVYEMTESSSVYCASPLSSARTTSGGQTRASRAQLKREIMRLYQRAAADVDKVEQTSCERQQQQHQPTSSINSSHSRSASSSNTSQSQPSARLFPMLDPMSPVFGVRNGSSSNSGGNQSRYAISPVASRPATANGATDPTCRPTLPPCNTSFWWNFIFYFFPWWCVLTLKMMRWLKARYDVFRRKASRLHRIEYRAATGYTRRGGGTEEIITRRKKGKWRSDGNGLLRATSLRLPLAHLREIEFRSDCKDLQHVIRKARWNKISRESLLLKSWHCHIPLLYLFSTFIFNSSRLSSSFPLPLNRGRVLGQSVTPKHQCHRYSHTPRCRFSLVDCFQLTRINVFFYPSPNQIHKK